MRKATLIIGGVAIIVVLVLAFSTPPAVTLTVRALTDDSRVAELYPGSNFQAVAAVVEMKNNSKRELLYTAYYPCPRIPYFRCRYREAGVWQDEPLDTANVRSFAECPAAITGQPWGPFTLKPDETVVFRADILRPKTQCRVAVDYWEKTPRKRWYHRLPASIVKRLPRTKDTFRAETHSITNGADS